MRSKLAATPEKSFILGFSIFDLMAMSVARRIVSSAQSIDPQNNETQNHSTSYGKHRQSPLQSTLPPVVQPQTDLIKQVNDGYGVDIGPFILHEEPKLICCSKCDSRSNPLRISDLKQHVKQFHSVNGTPEKDFEDARIKLVMKIGNSEEYQTIPTIQGPIRALRGLRINAEGVKCGGCSWARSRSSLVRAQQHARSAHDRPYEVVENVKVQVGKRGEHGSFLVYETDPELEKLLEKRPAMSMAESHRDARQPDAESTLVSSEEEYGASVSPHSSLSSPKSKKRRKGLTYKPISELAGSVLSSGSVPETQMTLEKQNLLRVYADTLSDTAKLLDIPATEHHRCFVRSMCALVVQEAAWQLQDTRMAPFMASAARSITADLGLFETLVLGVVDVLQNPNEFGP